MQRVSQQNLIPNYTNSTALSDNSHGKSLQAVEDLHAGITIALHTSTIQALQILQALYKHYKHANTTSAACTASNPHNITQLVLKVVTLEGTWIVQQ